jgi:hypothetical protein
LDGQFLDELDLKAEVCLLSAAERAAKKEPMNV